MTSTQSTNVDSKQNKTQQVMISPNKEWDNCVQRAARTVGFGILAGTLIGALVGAGVPVLWGTGICIAWSIKNCRALFRDGIVTPEMAKARKEKDKREKEEKRKEEQRKKEEEKMRKTKEREERARSIQSKTKVPKTDKDCCKVLEELQKKTDGKSIVTKTEETQQKQEQSAKAKTEETSSKKCDSKIVLKSASSGFQTIDEKGKAQKPLESEKNESNKKCGFKSEENLKKNDSKNAPKSLNIDQSKQMPSDMSVEADQNQKAPQSAGDATSKSVDPKTEQDWYNGPESRSLDKQSEVTSQNSSLPVKCSNIDGEIINEDSDTVFSPSESGLVFNSITTINVSSPRSPTKFTTVVETSGTNCTCDISGIDGNCYPHSSPNNQPDRTDHPEALSTNLEDITEHNDEFVKKESEELTRSGADLTSDVNSNKLECDEEIEDEDEIELTDNCSDIGPLSYSEAQLRVEEDDDKDTFNDEDEGREQINEEVTIIIDEDDGQFDNELAPELDNQRIPEVQLNKANETVGKSIYVVDKCKTGTWPLPFSLPSLERFQKKSNSSFKWPPLPSSVIVRPKKEPTCTNRSRPGRTPSCHCLSSGRCTCE